MTDQQHLEWLNSTQIPSWVDHREVRWDIEDLIIVYTRETDIYKAERLAYDEALEDWISVETYSPAESLRLARDLRLYLPAV